VLREAYGQQPRWFPFRRRREEYHEFAERSYSLGLCDQSSDERSGEFWRHLRSYTTQSYSGLDYSQRSCLRCFPNIKTVFGVSCYPFTLCLSHLKLLSSDWIAVNVLRSVALSTNSVAASVEPVMQQQFFSLSPMAGQENFNGMDVRPQHLMAHTPTTSSMLAALQNDTFPSGSLDPSTSTFNSDAYGSMSYMDTSTTQDSSLQNVHSSDLAFPDFSVPGNSFDVPGFHPDMGMQQSTGTPGSEHDQEGTGPTGTEAVKSE
jgi:hypothetical protein